MDKSPSGGVLEEPALLPDTALRLRRQPVPRSLTELMRCAFYENSKASQRRVTSYSASSDGRDTFAALEKQRSLVEPRCSSPDWSPDIN